MTTTSITSTGNFADGHIFVTPISQSGTSEPVIQIIDNNGEPIYIRQLPANKSAGGLKSRQSWEKII